MNFGHPINACKNVHYTCTSTYTISSLSPMSFDFAASQKELTSYATEVKKKLNVHHKEYRQKLVTTGSPFVSFRRIFK